MKNIFKSIGNNIRNFANTKNSLMLAAMLFASATVFTSCDKEIVEPEPKPQPPIVKVDTIAPSINMANEDLVKLASFIAQVNNYLDDSSKYHVSKATIDGNIGVAADDFPTLESLSKLKSRLGAKLSMTGYIYPSQAEILLYYSERSKWLNLPINKNPKTNDMFLVLESEKSKFGSDVVKVDDRYTGGDINISNVETLANDVARVLDLLNQGKAVSVVFNNLVVKNEHIATLNQLLDREKLSMSGAIIANERKVNVSPRFLIQMPIYNNGKFNNGNMFNLDRQYGDSVQIVNNAGVDHYYRYSGKLSYGADGKVLEYVVPDSLLHDLHGANAQGLLSLKDYKDDKDIIIERLNIWEDDLEFSGDKKAWQGHSNATMDIWHGPSSVNYEGSGLDMVYWFIEDPVITETLRPPLGKQTFEHILDIGTDVYDMCGNQSVQKIMASNREGKTYPGGGMKLDSFVPMKSKNGTVKLHATKRPEYANASFKSRVNYSCTGLRDISKMLHNGAWKSQFSGTKWTPNNIKLNVGDGDQYVIAIDDDYTYKLMNEMPTKAEKLKYFVDKVMPASYTQVIFDDAELEKLQFTSVSIIAAAGGKMR